VAASSRRRQYDEAYAALQRIGLLKTWTPAMAALGFLYGKMGDGQRLRTFWAVRRAHEIRPLRVQLRDCRHPRWSRRSRTRTVRS
jgi:hypothetical protein